MFGVDPPKRGITLQGAVFVINPPTSSKNKLRLNQQQRRALEELFHFFKEESPVRTVHNAMIR